MLKILGVAVGLTLGTLAHAVGLGGINVVSALGQPLKAEIELVAVGNEDKPGLVARLASPEAYKGAGLEYPLGVRYQFKVESRANGTPYLKLSSNQEINDPFVSLLVELSWSSGRLMREYTFLLDPPGYTAIQPKATAVQAVAPAAVAQSPAPAPAVAPAPQPVAAEPVAKPAAKPVEHSKPAAVAPVKAEPARASHVASGTITVKSGDTLSKIAASVKPEEISLERMLVALYKANADQFDGDNMNRIRTGRILRQPDQSELDSLSQSEAVQEIRAQSADWNAYRQKLAGAASTATASEAPRQVATGKITAAATDKTPVASESAKEVLRLSKGEKPGDKVASGAAGRAPDAAAKRDAAAEEAIAKAKAQEEDKKRVALLENNLKDMKHLAELKTDAAALAAAASAPEAVSAVAAASDVGAVSSVAAASAVKPTAAPVPTSYEEPSLLDGLLDSPAVLGGGAAALLALGGLAIAQVRRRRAATTSVAAEDVGETTIGASTGHLTEPIAPSPDTGDFTVGDNTAEVPAANHEEVDPLGEADLFLNFGRDEQAEQVLKDALLRTPDNHQIHLKLLGIYAKRQDIESFLKIENQLQLSGDDEAIRQAAILGQKLGAGDHVEDADSATAFMPRPDFGADPLLADTETAPADKAAEEVAAAQISEPVLDFDLTGAFPVVEQSKEVDFDVTATNPSMSVPDMMDFEIEPPAQVEEAAKEEGLPNLDDLIFDVTSASMPAYQTEAGVEPTAAPVIEEAADDAGMDFLLDFPIEEENEAPAQLPEINLADISLDMEDIAGAGEAVAPEAAPQQVGLPEIAIPEFTLDQAPVAIPGEASDAGETPVDETPLLDIPADVTPVDAAELWQEVATKIDLARAYQEMGDEVGAREILEEVMMDGDVAQKQEAQQMLSQLN
ncbi:MAG: LysM peptidoglycan-binding domain-containing protein [Gallionella sp.]|nr:LysM peptidoglycan-binding domain-containing protein [Gallionella sp.]MDD4947180.1 LysM peptidoglycan-binding domain-containing protein [Gallionella sp.]